MTTPDFRALCDKLLAVFDRYDDESNMGGVCQDELNLLSESRAALAQQQQGPTDKELLELMPDSMRDEFSYAASQCSELIGGRLKPDIFRMALDTAALEYARAVLARWGGAAPLPEVEHG